MAYQMKVMGNYDTTGLLQRNRQRSRLLTCLEAIYFNQLGHHFDPMMSSVSFTKLQACEVLEADEGPLKQL